MKVVFDTAGRALYFSRSPVPFYRDSKFDKAYIHIGIYCFRKNFLEIYPSLKPGILEAQEKLEQLRILENGYRIGVVVTEHRAVGVDTVEDIEIVRRLIKP